jgi:hypothetical protein
VFLDEIASGAPARDFLVGPYRTKLGTLERVPSYKAARLVTALMTDDTGFDPMESFSQGKPVALQERPWKALPNVVRAARAETLLETNPNECVEILRTLDEARALPILVRLNNHPALTIELAGKFGWGELVPDALTALLTTHSTAIPSTFPATLRALRRLGLRDEIVRLIFAADVTANVERHVLAAGAWAWLGDRRSQRVFDEAFQSLSGRLDSVNDMDRTRALARGYALASLEVAMAGAQRLTTLVRRVRDQWGTSSHFPLPLVHLTASICSIIDDAFTE